MLNSPLLPGKVREARWELWHMTSLPKEGFFFFLQDGKYVADATLHLIG